MTLGRPAHKISPNGAERVRIADRKKCPPLVGQQLQLLNSRERKIVKPTLPRDHTRQSE